MILAATKWARNGAMIVALAELGYLRKTWRTLDPTYGRGLWWTTWKPDSLVAHDITLDGVDFQRLPHGDDTFDAVAFDPPYVSSGGRLTTGITDMHARYGMDKAPYTPLALQLMINGGIHEAKRVLTPRGMLIMKCQDYISSGKLWPGTHYTIEYALTLKLEYVDRLEHIGNARAQPWNHQVHARRNYSTVLVFRKGK